MAMRRKEIEEGEEAFGKMRKWLFIIATTLKHGHVDGYVVL